MPIYVYECRKCYRQWEHIELSIKNDKQVRRCPRCKSLAERIPAVSNAQFKGPGFHATDYKGIK